MSTTGKSPSTPTSPRTRSVPSPSGAATGSSPTQSAALVPAPICTAWSRPHGPTTLNPTRTCAACSPSSPPRRRSSRSRRCCPGTSNPNAWQGWGRSSVYSLAAAQTPNGFEQGQVQQVALSVTSADFPRYRRNGAEQLGCPSIVSPSERDDGAAGRESDEARGNAIAGIECMTSQERALQTTRGFAVPCTDQRQHGVHITEGAIGIFDMLGPAGSQFQPARGGVDVEQLNTPQERRGVDHVCDLERASDAYPLIIDLECRADVGMREVKQRPMPPTVGCRDSADGP